jgi:hypothetical protein
MSDFEKSFEKAMAAAGSSEPDDNLYDEVIRLGIKHDHHESDLYIPYTPENMALARKYGKSAQTFKSNVDGKTWIDIPFAYSPFWEKKQREAQAMGPLAGGIERKRLEALKQAGHEPKRIKRITSHTGHARYLATLDKDAEIVGEIPRIVSSRYAYSPVHPVYRTRSGKHVFIVETAHKRYDVFEVPVGLKISPPDKG